MPHLYLGIARLPDDRRKPQCELHPNWDAPIFEATDYEGPEKACDEHEREFHPESYELAKAITTRAGRKS